MENASKALILAGSILIAIVIISLGVVLFSNLSGNVKNNANLDQQLIASFNEKLTPYVKKNISGSQVNVLIQTVISINNKAKTKNEDYKYVKITYNSKVIEISADGTLKQEFTRVTTGKYYNVEGAYDSNGLITNITISDS